MTRLRVHAFSISLDGFAAGPDQSADDPMGVGGMELHQWAFATNRYRDELGGPTPPPVDDVDDAAMTAGFDGIGAWILGRNMFGPVRGPWPDESWTGWWGDEPPYHCDVFVLTHHPRRPLELGGTTFHFVTDGVHAALDRAREAAAGLDVRLGGGAATVRQYLRAHLVDDLHLVVAPVLLGRGERLFEDLADLPAVYRVASTRQSTTSVHVHVEKAA
ncbi:dihydrofolate reductase family protein [Cellulomonas fimi]|uniref:Bifunctional deaminase-reductase domain protein n=1 Tax=Cellulomonas fimi (strain ATCC 484 / DSM 20113 / JCM 1341 / CCUG 24087 / LMG 16345 / NBRC 15513 / NCIMB 8980 / NCTC 7547 / NRS-133) TaxID=590998 RepID=F4H859_CELFA|nr:dihydrofolate reductase family protein [Cellulomonas fimi]AEE44616.1 bifunctional deaminase-reductase domain protein [Cellulomonas fimi ATCC 484]NNH08785.1 dihydrofolate reductase [Cellulomonas fimi]VEH26792.1 RibD C-terminal domain [Cellulomonas fimi]